MPQLKVQHIVSVSSEDRNYPAENLLKGDGFKKWKGKPGDKNVSVILQFPKAEKIHQIDVGNENSAFIEVLVGQSTGKDEDYKVIVVASSFMAPAEARNTQNGNRVRIFSQDKLSKAVCDEKWDRVKVVCTQPFNKTTAYGLSFVKFHGTPADGEELPKEEKPVKLGAFAIKTDDSSDSLKPGALFAKKDKQESVVLTGAAAMRAASKQADESGPSTPPVKRRHDEGPSPGPFSSSKKPHNDRPSLKKQSTSLSSVASSTATSSHRDHSPPPLKKSKTEPGKPSKEKAFSQLLKKVVFVLSGYQNPERAKIRDRAMEMGGTYKPDWGKGCTHLICAFEKTPKYQEVKGKGRIVTKDWVKECYRSKRLQPWRKYRLGRAPSPGASSSESDDEPSPVKHRASPSAAKATVKKEKFDAPTDSGEDTEDELRKLEEKKNSPAKNGKGAEDKSIYDAATDEEMSDDGKDLALPELPDFFKGKTFFLYGKWDATERRSVRRYLIAYNGALDDYMSDKVTHVVTGSPWDENFDKALTDNPSLHFVRPKWIHACYDQQKLLPHQKFIVVPS